MLTQLFYKGPDHTDELCISCQPELVEKWRALIQSQYPMHRLYKMVKVDETTWEFPPPPKPIVQFVERNYL